LFAFISYLALQVANDNIHFLKFLMHVTQLNIFPVSLLGLI